MSRKEYAIFLTEQEQEEASIRHKFLSEEEKLIFRMVYEEMQQVQKFVSYEKKEGEKRIVVASLGKQIDELQNQYMAQGEYLKAYGIDCLAMEILMKFYEMIKEEFRKTGYFIKEMLYPGEQVPIEQMKFLFQKTKPLEISYNKQFLMEPKKSIAMIVVLTKEKQKACQTICDGCKNKTCAARRNRRESAKKTYGYQRIFTK